MKITGDDLSVEVPPGWDGSIARTGAIAPQGRDGARLRAPTVAHLANFPLPAVRADFGAEAVETMRAGDVLVVLFEYGEEAAGTALFSHEGMPRITSRDFDPDALQYRVRGQSGLQRFFRLGSRAFCLYVVVGSHLDRADVVAEVNEVLESVVVS